MDEVSRADVEIEVGDPFERERLQRHAERMQAED